MINGIQYDENNQETKMNASKERIKNRLTDLKSRYQNLLSELNNSNILNIDKIFDYKDDYDFNSDKLLNKINENIEIQDKVNALQKSIINRMENIERINNHEMNKINYDEIKKEVENSLKHMNDSMENDNSFFNKQIVVETVNNNNEAILKKIDSIEEKFEQKFNSLIMSEEQATEFKEHILILQNQIDQLLQENVDFKSTIDNLNKINYAQGIELKETQDRWIDNLKKLDNLGDVIDVQNTSMEEFYSEKDDLIGMLETKLIESKVEIDTIHTKMKQKKDGYSIPEHNPIQFDSNLFSEINKHVEEYEGFKLIEKSPEDSKETFEYKVNLVELFGKEIEVITKKIQPIINDLEPMLVELKNRYESIENASEFDLLKIKMDDATSFDEVEQANELEQFYKSLNDIEEMNNRLPHILNDVNNYVYNHENVFDINDKIIILNEFNNIIHKLVNTLALIINGLNDMKESINENNVAILNNNQLWKTFIKDFEILKNKYEFFINVFYSDTNKLMFRNNPRFTNNNVAMENPLTEQIDQLINEENNVQENNVEENKIQENNVEEETIDNKITDLKNEINIQLEATNNMIIEQLKNIESKIDEEQNKQKNEVTYVNQEDEAAYKKNLRLKIVLRELEKIKNEIDLYENQQLHDVLCEA